MNKIQSLEKQIKKYQKDIQKKDPRIQKKLMTTLDMMFNKGKTISQIAPRYKTTRQALWQFIRRHVPDIRLPNNFGNQGIPMVELTCSACNKKYEIPVSRERHNKAQKHKRRYCSMKCVGQGKHKFSKSANWSPEYRKKMNAKKAKKWYHAHKNDPGIKELVKRRNEKANLKRLRNK